LALARHLPFAASVPFGRDDEGVLLRVASDRPFDGGWIAAVEAAFGVADAPLVTLDEPRGARRRHVLLAAGRLRFVLLAGEDLESEPWLRELLLQRTDAAALGARLLRSGATAPLAIERRGRNVCNCVGVSEAEIRRALGAAGGDRAERIEAARSRTGRGSQCGACLAEVGRLADDCLRALHPPDTTTAGSGSSLTPPANGIAMQNTTPPSSPGPSPEATPESPAGARRGWVALVGAGPGDPELLTLGAARRIGEADVTLVDDLVDPRILAHARPTARIRRVGKRGGCRSTPQRFIEALMVREARAGLRVVRLKGGDPL